MNGSRHQDVVWKSNGTPAGGAAITVYLSDGVTLATVYSDRALTTTLANPFSADANGNFGFYALPGTYTLKFTGNFDTFTDTAFIPSDMANERQNVRDFGAKGDGVTDDSAAFTAALAALTSGGTVVVPPGAYVVNNVSVNNSVRIIGAGGSGWTSASSQEPTRLLCTATSGVIFHVVGPAGPTVIQHNGPTIEYLAFRDGTNAGAGGLATGGILVESTNRGGLIACSFENFSGSGSYAVKWDGSQGTDASYWKVVSPRVGNCDFGFIQTGNNGSAMCFDGGEVSGNTVGFDLQLVGGFPTNTTSITGTSIEVPSNAIGIRIATKQALINGRFEAGTSTTNTIAVQLLSTAAANVIRGSFNKFTVCVDDQAGSLNNQIDVSNNVNCTTLFSAQGDGSQYIQAGRGIITNSLISGTRTAIGQRIFRDAKGTNTAVILLGAGDTRLMNSNRIQPIAVSGLSRSANVVTCTTVFNHGFSTPQIIIVDSAADSSFNGIFTLTSASGITLTWAQVAANATSGYGYVTQSGGMFLSSRGSNEGIFGAGAQGSGVSSLTATDAAPGVHAIVSGVHTFYGDTGKTVGNAYTPTARATIDTAGVVTGNGGIKCGSSGNTIALSLSASATLTYTSIAAQSSQEQTITVTGATAGKAVFASPAATLGNANLSWSAWVSATNTVSVRVTNPTTGAVTPSAVSWNVWVLQ